MAKLRVSCGATCSLYGHLNSERFHTESRGAREADRKGKKRDYLLRTAHAAPPRIITPFNELFVGYSLLAGNRLYSLNILRTNLPDERSMFRYKIDQPLRNLCRLKCFYVMQRSTICLQRAFCPLTNLSNFWIISCVNIIPTVRNYCAIVENMLKLLIANLQFLVTYYHLALVSMNKKTRCFEMFSIKLHY